MVPFPAKFIRATVSSRYAPVLTSSSFSPLSTRRKGKRRSILVLSELLAGNQIRKQDRKKKHQYPVARLCFGGGVPFFSFCFEARTRDSSDSRRRLCRRPRSWSSTPRTCSWTTSSAASRWGFGTRVFFCLFSKSGLQRWGKISVSKRTHAETYTQMYIDIYTYIYIYIYIYIERDACFCLGEGAEQI